MSKIKDKIPDSKKKLVQNKDLMAKTVGKKVVSKTASK